MTPMSRRVVGILHDHRNTYLIRSVLEHRTLVALPLALVSALPNKQCTK